MVNTAANANAAQNAEDIHKASADRDLIDNLDGSP
jgi:hypothetical protein